MVCFIVWFFFWVLCIYLESGMFVKILIKKIRLIFSLRICPCKIGEWREGPNSHACGRSNGLAVPDIWKVLFFIFNLNINSNWVYLDFGPPPLILLTRSSHYTAHTFGIFAVWRLHNGLPLHDSFVEWNIRAVHLLLTRSLFVFPSLFSHTLCGVSVSNKILFVLEISFCFFLIFFFKEIKVINHKKKKFKLQIM